MSQEQEQKVEKIGFGYVDDTSSDLQTKSRGVFGLNQGVFLTKFELNETAGKDNSAQDAIDVTLQVNDGEIRQRVYPTEKVYDKDNNEVTDKNSPEYAKLYNENWKQKNAWLVHILKCFKTDEEVKQALSVPISSFKDFASIITGLLPDGFQNKPLDVFLEYQWTIPDGKDRTFLQMPNNMKGGAWLIPHVAATGKWEEVKTEDGLEYRDSANGEKHPFTRNANFMESNKANQQIEGQEANDNALAAGAAGAGTGGAKKSGW